VCRRNNWVLDVWFFDWNCLLNSCKTESVCFVSCPKQGIEIEGVVIHRVGFLEYFCPKQGQDFKPSVVLLYSNMGQVPPSPASSAVAFYLELYLSPYRLTSTNKHWFRVIFTILNTDRFISLPQTGFSVVAVVVPIVLVTFLVAGFTAVFFYCRRWGHTTWRIRYNLSCCDSYSKTPPPPSRRLKMKCKSMTDLKLSIQSNRDYISMNRTGDEKC